MKAANVPDQLIEEMTGKEMAVADEDVDGAIANVILDDEEQEWVEIDFETVESHTLVEKYEDGSPVRSQMVYVDEYSCIGCTYCSGIADNTFFMEPDMGRARVFQQWGDDAETIAAAIETCPVDCIHFVPYEELVDLEIGRRNQNINNKVSVFVVMMSLLLLLNI